MKVPSTCRFAAVIAALLVAGASSAEDARPQSDEKCIERCDVESDKCMAASDGVPEKTQACDDKYSECLKACDAKG